MGVQSGYENGYEGVSSGCVEKVVRGNRKWVFMETPCIHGGRGNYEEYPQPTELHYSSHFNVTLATIFLSSLGLHISCSYFVKAKGW